MMISPNHEIATSFAVMLDLPDEILVMICEFVLKFDVACNCLSSTARFIHVDFTRLSISERL